MSETAPYDILIRNCMVLTGEPAMPVLRDAVIGIRGDRLALVVEQIDAPAARGHRTIDASGHLATPGFINIHTHAVLCHARGMTEDLGWAPAYTPGVPHVEDVREDEAAALAQLAGLEMLTLGSTLINDMYCHAHATLPAIAELGVRISSSAWIHDVDFSRVHDGVWRYDPSIGARMMHDGLDHIARWQGAFDGRATVMFAPHAIDTCSRDFLVEVAQERQRLGLRVMTHLAQSRIEVAQVFSRDGITPTELVDEVGLLDGNLIAAHCLVMTDSDVARAGRAGITVAHAPKVNMTGGYLPVTSALRRAGAQVALGTDNMHGDIVETMRWALASGRLQEQAVNAMWQPADVFAMATSNGAAALGRAADLGTLAAGKKADVVLFDFRRGHLTPSFQPVRTLVHTGQGRDVAMVIVDGRIVVEDGHATMVDEEMVRARGQAAARALWTRVTGCAPESFSASQATTR